MRNKIFHTIFILLLILYFSGCSHKPRIHQYQKNEESGKSVLSTQEAVSIAQDVGDENGFFRKNYHTVDVSFSPNEEMEWELFFRHNPPAYPGSDFMVLIDDDTRKAEFVY